MSGWGLMCVHFWGVQKENKINTCTWTHVQRVLPLNKAKAGPLHLIHTPN